MVIEPLRPTRGGFLRPFGCAWFIREYLLGNGPMGAPSIEAHVGAPQTDIFRCYKEALFRAYAEDKVAMEEEDRIRKGMPPLSAEEAEKRTLYYFERIPQRLSRARYASFTRYFSHIKRLGYVETTGEEEHSLLQENYPPAPPRTYYRLTDASKKATASDLADPIITLYQYSREKRSAKRKYRYS